MPKDTKTMSGSVARDKKAGSSTSWRGLPTKLKDLPNSEQLFSMWGNDSFRRAPPVVPTNSAIWDAKDPSRPLPYSFETPTPIAPPPVAGVAFATKPKVGRPKQAVKQPGRRRRLLPALHPTSQSGSSGPSSTPATVIAIPMPCYPHLAPPSPPIDYPDEVAPYSWPPPPPPGQVKKEAVVEELPYASSVSGSEQGWGSERDHYSSEPSICSVSRTGSPSPSIATPPSSPPLRPWSSPSGACLSPLMLGQGISMGNPAKSCPAITRAHSDPPQTALQSRDEVTLSIYEACRQRRLPPMTFKKPVASSPGLDPPHMGMGPVLPPLRDSSDSDEHDSTDEGRDFDASHKTGRKVRHAPYYIPDAPWGEHNLKESETDLPPLRLLLDQLELDEQRRAQSESHPQPPSDTILAAKLPIPQALTQKRSSATPARRRGRVATKKLDSAAPSVPSPALAPRLMAPVAPFHFGEFWVDCVPGYGAANPRAVPAAVHPQHGGLHAL